jgi:soluble P-type ATPase
MLHIDIPGNTTLDIHHLVLDYNGTLAQDGAVLPGVRERLEQLKTVLAIHIVTADTYGTVCEKVAALPVELQLLGPTDQDIQKRDTVRDLGARGVVAVGNGRNDALMLAEAGLGIAVMQREGCSLRAIQAADILTADIRDALDLLLVPARLQASLRN